MAEPGRALGARLGALALWLMPCTVIFEWVGGTFYKAVPVRIAYLGLFLGLYWLSSLRAEPEPLRVRWGLGVGALVVGAAIATYALWWLLGPRLGWPPQARSSWFDREPIKLLLPLLAAWPLAVGCELLAGGGVGPRAYQRLGAFLALGFLLHFATHVRVQGLPVSVSTPWLWALVAIMLALALVPRGPFAVRLAALLCAGFALRMLGIAVWDIDPRVRDMLALVHSAQDRFAHGENPYAAPYAMQLGSVLPLTYLPGLWLGYGVPRLLGLDLRVFGPCLELLLFAGMARVTRRVEPGKRAWAEAVVFTFAAVWLFSPSVQWNVIYAEPSAWWCLLGATLLFSFAGPYWLGALLLGLSVATRHFALVLAPFVLLYFVRVRGLRGSLPLLAIAGGTAGALLCSFAVGAPELFWFGTLRWLREYGPVHLSWFLDRFGFLSLFVERDALALLPYVQAGLVLACLMGAWLSRATRAAPFAATASLLFIMFNVLIWDSFLLDGAMAAAALLVTGPLRAESAPEEPTSRAFYTSLSVLVLTALAGGYLVFTLITTLHPSGRSAAHDFMVDAVRAGDRVIDRSDRRIAFVEGRWLLRREEVPAPIGGDFFDPAWGGDSALTAHGKVWLITEARRDASMREAFAKLGTAEPERAFGHYRVQAIVPAHGGPVPLAGRPRRCRLGWNERAMTAFIVQKDKPVRLTGVNVRRGMFAAGIPNELVTWPHLPLYARIGERRVEIPNLPGVIFTSVDASGPLTLELSTDDPAPRELCVELTSF